MQSSSNYKSKTVFLIALWILTGCCTPNQSTLVSPTVVTVAPAALSNAACPTAVITATFSEPLNAATVNGTSVLVTGPNTTAVAGVVTYQTTGNTVSFFPANALLPSVTYTVTITTAIKDQYGNAMAANYVYTFTTAANSCHAPPVLVSITPTGSATGVCPNAAVVATFNEPMNPATINAQDFTLSPGVVGTVTHDATNTIFTLTPSSALASGATYTINISSAAQDAFTNPLSPAVVSTFSTAANGCHPPPVVNSVSPVNGTAGFCPNKIVTATFNEAMTASTINGQTFKLTGGGAAIAGVVTYSAASNTAIFTPSAALPLNTTFTATITTGVQDTYGNQLPAAYVWTFATGANTCLPPAPPITVTPASGATGVCSTSVVSATFVQAMNPATINATSFTLTPAGGIAVAGTVTANAAGTAYTLTPTAALAFSTVYTATISTAAQDPFGNALAAPYSWSFTTAAATCGTPTVPVVTSVSPAQSSLGVCANSVVVATFNEPMSAATINTANFYLTPFVAGTVSLDSTGKVATFTPNANLPYNATYTATISTGAKDLNGNSLAANYTWTFSTAQRACQAPVPLGSAANFLVLAGSTVTNTGPTNLTGGNLGLSPGSSVTGFPPGTLTTPAVQHITDPAAAQAQLDLTIAYNYAAGLAGGSALAADVSGITLTPGLWTNGTSVVLNSGNLTLDAQGNPNAVFIFQIGSTLTTIGNTQIVLLNGAQAKNIFWQVGSSATLGTNSVFQGTIMALTSITLNTGATLNGRALASNGAVTLNSNPVTAP